MLKVYELSEELGMHRSSSPPCDLGHMEARLAAIPNLFDNPVRAPPGDPPFFSAELEARAAPLWHPCSSCAASAKIPNQIHQPWLHGNTPKWEHLLGMLAARFVASPERYVLYYDKLPRSSPQWSCACAIASCTFRQPVVTVPLRRGRRIKMGHWPELMRYDLLLEHGGIFLDHDSYVLKPLDTVRRCCAGASPPARPAAVIAGFEQEEQIRKLNPGTLLAEPNAEFLKLWRASWFNYSSRDWDYNCCQVSYRLHAAVGAALRSHLRADLGPLPRYEAEAQYDRHLARATVVHVTALSQPWRRRDSRRFGIMAKVSRLVLRRVNASWAHMTDAQRSCVQLTAAEMARKHASSE